MMLTSTKVSCTKRTSKLQTIANVPTQSSWAETAIAVRFVLKDS